MLGLIFSLFISSVYAGDCDHSDGYFHCVKYIKNYDGDSITVDIPNVHPLLGSKIEVRVLGIDAPEMKSHNECEKAAAKKAKLIVQNMLSKAKRIDLLNVGRDKYFRIDADVIADGKSIKDELMRLKLSYLYDGGKKSVVDWCNH